MTLRALPGDLVIRNRARRWSLRKVCHPVLCVLLVRGLHGRFRSRLRRGFRGPDLEFSVCPEE